MDAHREGVLEFVGIPTLSAIQEAMDALAEAVRKGVVVVRSTRLVSGDVGRNVEVEDDALGFVAADQLNPQKSRVLLKLCLTRSVSPAAVQDAFYLY